MAARDAWTCVACGSRNRAKWDFCARCGEAYQEAAAAPAAAVEPARGAPPPRARTLSPATLIALLALLGLGVWGALRGSAPATDEPRADAFAMPTQPTAPPPAATAALGPAELAMSRADALLAAGSVSEAVDVLSRAVVEVPDHARLQHAYARALARSGATERALDAYRRAARLAPEDPAVRADLARALIAAGRREDAAAEFESAVALQPHDRTLVQQAAEVMAQTGRAAQAVPLLQRTLEQSLGDPLIAQQLGETYEALNDWESAAGIYESMLERLPDADVTRGRLAEVRFRQGRVEDAVGIFRSGLAQHNSPLLRRGLGSLLERAGKAAEAAAEYREYARLAPNAADAHALAQRADALAGSPRGGGQ